MRIAQVSPLIESVPPQLYGGTERIVSYLTEELVALGHEVTLFASGDSRTAADLVSCCPQSLRLAGVPNALPYNVLQIEEVCRRAREFDIFHFHIDYLHFPVARHLASPSVTTMHGRLDLPDYEPLFAVYDDMPLASISDHQRLPLAARWIATVYHGLPDGLYRRGPGDGGYLAFLGRICPEKRPDRAIEIAARAGRQLKIAAKVDEVDRAYFEDVIRPLLGQPHVDYIGEISDGEKENFLGRAEAVLFPIDWPEPFGLVLIEAMACGTPVVAWRKGSTAEVIDEGVTGFLVESVEQAVAAVGRLGGVDRAEVRRQFEARFTAGRMAREYLAVYAALIGTGEPAQTAPSPGRVLAPQAAGSRGARLEAVRQPADPRIP